MSPNWSFARTCLQSGDDVPLGQFPEHQAEVGVDQVVDLLRAVDSGDVTQLRVGRGVEADEARDDASLPGQHLRRPATAGRLHGGWKREELFNSVPVLNVTQYLTSPRLGASPACAGCQ